MWDKRKSFAVVVRSIEAVVCEIRQHSDVGSYATMLDIVTKASVHLQTH